MDMKKCPACGMVLEADADRCPACSLEGLNQIFLSQEAYDAWYRAVVEPRIPYAPPRVFAGETFGLILTAAGDLYGIGRNDFHQISRDDDSFFSQPHLIARDVVSAAASANHTVYVTRDGGVHLLGMYARWFPGFSDAKEVYADPWHSICWIVRQDGEVFAMGDNEDEALEPRRVILEKPLPVLKGIQTASGFGYSWIPSDDWPNCKQWTLTVAGKIMTSGDYRALAEAYSRAALVIDHNPVENGDAGAEVFAPIIRVTNRHIFQPVPHRPDWIPDTRHRCGCRPFLQKEYTPELSQPPGTKKVSGHLSFKPCSLCLLEDGTVIKPGGESLEAPNQPVADLSLGSNILMMSCRNGDVFWYRYVDNIPEGGTRFPADLLRAP